MPSKLPAVTVRMTNDLLDRVRKASKEEFRTVNATIVLAITMYLEARGKEAGT